MTENPDFTRVNRYLHILKTPGVSFDIYPAIVGMRARELRFEKIDETHLSFTGTTSPTNYRSRGSTPSILARQSR